MSKINTVIAVALTSNLRLADAPGNVFLASKHTDLPKDSVANISQLVTLDKLFLVECIGVLPSPLLEQIDQGIRLILDL
jgi:mRNA interferase MazF